jgi:hypothetical protein
MEMMLAAKAIALFVAATVAARAPDYQAGQIWEYRTRPIDAGSLLKIQKVEADPVLGQDGAIYHISIVGVHLFGQPVASAIEHLPVTRSVLDASVTRRVSSDAVFPDIETGIASWREASGGVFTIPLDQVVTAVDQIATEGRATRVESSPPS